MPIYAHITALVTGNPNMANYLKTVGERIDYKDLLTDVIFLLDRMRITDPKRDSASYEALEIIHGLASGKVEERVIYENVIASLKIKGYHVHVQFMESPEIKLLPR